VRDRRSRGEVQYHAQAGTTRIWEAVLLRGTTIARFPPEAISRRRLDSPDAGHPNVDRHEVDVEALGLFDALLATTRAAYPLKRSCRVEQRVRPVPERGLVIDHQNPYGAAGRSQGII
jgi:hypothetical protein